MNGRRYVRGVVANAFLAFALVDAAATAGTRPPSASPSPSPSASPSAEQSAPSPTEATASMSAEASPSPSPKTPATPSAPAPEPTPSPQEPEPAPSQSPREAAPSSSPSVVAPSPEPPSRRFAGTDRIGGLLNVVWQCSTYGGNRLTHAFYRGKDDASMIGVTKFLLANRVGSPPEHYEYYAYSARTHEWTARLGGGILNLSAPAWNEGATWTFGGTLLDGKQSLPAEMRFTALPDGRFRREFLEERAGVWTTFSGEVCSAPRRR